MRRHEDTSEKILRIEDATILWPNFSGRETRYNKAGDRNFTLVIYDQELAERLKDDGWNIKEKPPYREGDDPQYHMPVVVNFRYHHPPRIKMITKSNGHMKQKLLTEETVGLLDEAYIESVDLAIRPRYWENNGNSGIKAYLKTLYAVIEADEFEDKYADEEYPEDGDEESPF